MNVEMIAINRIVADFDSNCRDQITAESVRELSDSIHGEGLLAPLIVVPSVGHPGLYRLIAGFRRYTAINVHLGWLEIPCVVRDDLSDDQEKIINLRENLDREGLSLAEEGRAIQNSYPRHWSTRRLAKALGRSEEFVAVRLMTLRLPEWVQNAQAAGRLTLKDMGRIGRSNDPEGMARAFMSDDKQERRKYQVREKPPLKSEVRKWVAAELMAGALDVDILRLVGWAIGDITSEVREECTRRLSN